MTALTTVADIQRELRRRRDAATGDGAPLARTSVMTHVAWIPPEWHDVALATLAGLGEAHPSRTILLLAEPQSSRDGFEGSVELRRFGRGGGQICSEVISIRLLGRASEAPASVVLPLLRSDLPVFLRWRGSLLAAPEVRRQLLQIADRLIVDSDEWPDPGADREIVIELFETVAVSDVAWAVTESWRRAIAGAWPEIAAADRLLVDGPRNQAELLAGWLRSRLGRAIALEVRPAGRIERVQVGDAAIVAPRRDDLSASELLSAELEIYTRDPIYEQALAAA